MKTVISVGWCLEDRRQDKKEQRAEGEQREKRDKVGEMTEWREWNHSLKMAVGRVHPSGPPKSGDMGKEESSGGGCQMPGVFSVQTHFT